MKTTAMIVAAIIVLILLALRYHSEQPTGKVKICSTTRPGDCIYVDQGLVNTVFEKALIIAQRDDAETFPVESLDEFSANHSLSSADLSHLYDEVVDELKINVNTCQKNVDSIQELILSLNNCLNQ